MRGLDSIRLLGAATNWRPGKQRRSRDGDSDQRRVIGSSGLFDAEYYLANNKDVALSGVDPLEHFHRWGGAEGRSPSAGFDSQFYLEANPDVSRAKLNPLVHYLLHGQAEGRLPLRPQAPAAAYPARVLDDLGELYHEYSLFGVANRQYPGIYPANQACKSPIINAYIQLAIAKSKRRMTDEVTFAELFCADGYYAMAARHFGAARSYGLDNDRDGHSAVTQTIAERLRLDAVTFLQQDVNEMTLPEPIDIVANVGGLYHVSNPREVLAKSYDLARRYLIVQSVVSMANDDPDYFETPAPGWTWGCRFNRISFERMLAGFGWKVLDSHFNELEGNTRPEDRGSVYFLIEPLR